MTRNMVAWLVLPLVAVAFAGCAGDDETIHIAFVGKDTALEPHEDPQRLADWMTAQTGRPVKVTFFTTGTAALAAVASGQADFVSADGAAAWLAWKQLGLETIASEVRGDGRTHYMASAWVQADSPIQTVDDLRGVTSCHTGATKSAGMFMPMGYLVREGHIDAGQYADDISQVQVMAQDFFDEPVIGGAYADYIGSLRCLSEGVGDVAFIRDTTPADYCTPPTARDWCLGLSAYRELVQFGPVPEHAIMVGKHVSADARADILAALLALNDSDDGRAILSGVFGTHGIAAVAGSEAHLGGYGELIGVLPGIERYAQAK